MVAGNEGQLKPWLENPLKIWVGSDPWDAPCFGNRPTLDFLDVGSEINWWGT